MSLAATFPIPSTLGRVMGADGDSRFAETTAGDPTTLPRCHDPIRALVRGTYPTKFIPFVNISVDGATIQARAAAIAAAVTLSKITHLITYATINDITAGRTTAQIKADWATYCTNAFGAGLKKLLVVPCDFKGELWSVGDAGTPNVNDAAIKDVLLPANLPATLDAHARSADICYFDARAKVFMKYEPVYNGPAPGVAGGILCQDNPGLHHRPLMKAQFFAEIRNFIVFTG